MEEARRASGRARGRRGAVLLRKRRPLVMLRLSLLSSVFLTARSCSSRLPMVDSSAHSQTPRARPPSLQSRVTTPTPRIPTHSGHLVRTGHCAYGMREQIRSHSPSSARIEYHTLLSPYAPPMRRVSQRCWPHTTQYTYLRSPPTRRNPKPWPSSRVMPLQSTCYVG